MKLRSHIRVWLRSAPLFLVAFSVASSVPFGVAWGAPTPNSSSKSSCARLVAQATEARAADAIAMTENWRDLADQVTPQLDHDSRLYFDVRGGLDQEIPSSIDAYQTAQFRVATAPRRPLKKGAKVYRNIDFGYKLPRGFRHIGPLNYVVVAADGNVVEVGGGSSEVLTAFTAHVFGRNLSSKELKRISYINGKLIADLRADPASREKLKAFARDRKWPEGLADKGRLAYFDGSIKFVQGWAAKNGFSMRQMRDAGWVTEMFEADGKPRYKVVGGPRSIKIPYFDENGGIPVWRSRNLDSGPKIPRYQSWQLDRSINRRFTVAEALYNGAALKNAAGKTVVITEGEFKCLMANRAGVLTVGIPGITQIDGNIIQGLVDSKASEIVVILDRDPRGKALMRVDEITDSQRASYFIAQELKAAGAPNVRIGTLPDVFDGGKVGIDDLIIAKGKEPFLDTIKNAQSPEDFARAFSMDMTLQDLYQRRQKLAKRLALFELFARKTGQDRTGADYAAAKDAFTQIDRALTEYLDTKFNHAKSLAQPSANWPSLPMVNFSPYGEVAPAAKITYGPGERLPYDLFTNPILLFQNLPDELGHDFPGDEYNFKYDVTISNGNERAVIPVVIFKNDGGKAVAFAQTGNSDSTIREILRPVTLH